MSRYVYRGQKFSVKIGECLLPSGKRTSLEVVEYPGAVAVLPLLDGDNVVLIRQYRPAIGVWIYEVPAGTFMPGEEPGNCALRELEEETGYRAGRLAKMFEMYTAPGYSTEILHSYLAEDLERGEASLEEDEELTVEVVPLDRAVEMVRRNEIQDGKTMAIILYYVENKTVAWK